MEGESGKKILTFHLTVWASRAFPLRRSPQMPPVRRVRPATAGEKRAEPAIFGVLGARLGVFLAPAPKKWPGGLLGAQLEML